MKNNLIFKLSKQTIIISQMKKDVDYKNLNNTNIIDVKDLKFSTDYIEENKELVANFLNVVILKKNINIIEINNMEIANIAMELINEWEHIKTIIFKPDKKISMDIFLKLLDNKYIEKIECFEMPPFLIERLDLNKNIKVITRHEYTFSSNFMRANMLDSYSDIYYKKMIVIKDNFTQTELEDFKTFIAINSRLKLIKIVVYSNELLASIIDELIKYKKNNILIEIDEKNNDLNSIYNSVAYIKKCYKQYFEENNIKFNLNYSKEYKKKNFFKEINFKLFSAIIVLILIVGSITMGINYYIQYIDEEKINTQLNELEEILESAEIVTTIDDNETDIDYIDDSNIITTTTKKKSNYVSAYYTNYSKVFEKLLKKNKDTVGWLTVNNTKIDYPVVQSSTNSYYLNRDYNKKKNSMGWIFMDYRNDPVNLNQNTIIYGHNIKTGIMFGTIKYMLNSSWYKKPSNQIITFNTVNKNMKWQIFSIYQIKTTEDYLKTEFKNDEDYLKFINKIKKRSKYNFKIDVNENSKILTLSTCFSSTTRHVVHAVLIEDEEQVIKNAS